MKTAFLLSVSTAAKNHHVIQSYLNHKGAYNKIINRVGDTSAKAMLSEGEGIDILCCQLNVEKTNYAFVSKSDLERGLIDDLWIGLVLFIDDQKPTKYLFPSTLWNQPNQLITDSAVKHPECGINLIAQTMKVFVEKYAFEKKIDEL